MVDEVREQLGDFDLQQSQEMPAGEPWMSELEQLEMLLDAPWDIFPPEFYEDGGYQKLAIAYERAKFGDPED